MTQKQKAALQALNIFEGMWHTTGDVFATADAPAMKMSATDTYEWMPGGYFMKHTVDAHMGDDHYQNLEIIGYDKDAGNYTLHSYDNNGNSGIQTGFYKYGKWHFGDDTMRATLTPQNPNTLVADWELKDDTGQWQPWMHITLKK